MRTGVKRLGKYMTIIIHSILKLLYFKLPVRRRNALGVSKYLIYQYSSFFLIPWTYSMLQNQGYNYYMELYSNLSFLFAHLRLRLFFVLSTDIEFFFNEHNGF